MKYLINSKVKSFTVIIAIFCILLLGFGSVVSAQDPQSKLQGAYKASFGQELNDPENLFTQQVGGIIRIILATVGTVFVVVLVYAGYLWLTAGGNDTQLAKAKSLMINGVIGLAITLAAYLISDYVFIRLVASTVGG